MEYNCYKRNQETQEVGNCSIEEIISFLERNSEIECDTETLGFDPHTHDILCVQFGNTDNQYLIKWEDSLVEILKPFFEDQKKTFLFQNAKFDLQFFYKKGIIISNVYDTFLVETILTNGVRDYGRGLSDLVSKYAGKYMSKAVRDTITTVGLTKAVIDYGLDDVKYLSIIKKEQQKLLEKQDLTKTAELDNNFVKILAYTEFNGIAFDKERWEEKSKKDLDKLADLEKQLSDYIISKPEFRKYTQYGTLFDPPGTIVCTLNFSSPPQIQKLFKELGLDITVEEDGEMKDSVGKQVLQKNIKHPFVEIYAKYVKCAKRVSSFGMEYLNFINPSTGRIHTSYKQIMNTGRMSSGNAKQNKPNLQQVPNDDEHRPCFKAADGHKLICADYTGQEAVIFANKCKDKNLLKFYDDNLGDMHSYVASLCFPKELEGLSLSEIKKQRPDLRQLAKGAGFAIQFGGVGKTIADNLGLSLEEGEAVYKAYTEAFPEMFDYFKKVSDEAKERGYVVFNELTRRKFYFSFMNEYLDAKNTTSEKGYWTEYREEKKKDSDYFNNVMKPTVKKLFKHKGTIERTSYNYPKRMGVTIVI